MSLKSNIKLTISYEGTAYLGWQKTPFGESIEGALQKVLELILQEPIYLQAASRTDAGVHARGQVVNFFSCKHPLDLKRLQHSVNCLLPKDIIVVKAELAASDFHPTLDCTGKEYHYSICNTPFQYPEFRRYSWHVHQNLDIMLMRKAATMLIGEHDFAAFCNVKKNEEYAHHVRRMDSIEIVPLVDRRFTIKMRGNHFLYKMARNIAGLVVDVGRGKLKLESVVDILNGKDRTQGGVTAPAHGLSLYQVFY